MRQAAKLVYTARTRTTGGRQRGVSRSSDGRLDVRLSEPGSAGIGTSPEHLFAAAWSACFGTAIKLAAQQRKLPMPESVTIDAEVNINLVDSSYVLSVRLNIHLPGVERDTAQTLIDDADRICPYSKATRGNIDVAINVVE